RGGRRGEQARHDEQRWDSHDASSSFSRERPASAPVGALAAKHWLTVAPAASERTTTVGPQRSHPHNRYGPNAFVVPTDGMSEPGILGLAGRSIQRTTACRRTAAAPT